MAFLLSNFQRSRPTTASRSSSTPTRSAERRWRRGIGPSLAWRTPTRSSWESSFASADDAKSFREKLREEGILENMTVKAGPAVVEVADEARY
jgi:hypothetical protein